MASLKKLEIDRLFKELEYLESQYNFSYEVINQSEIVFNKSLNSFIENYPDLKIIWDDINSEKENIIDDSINIESDNDEIFKDTNNSIKRLYREIVKLTHPDVVKNLRLNNMYIEATNAYHSNDEVEIYKICNNLMIDFIYDDILINKIGNKIRNIKAEISMLESTYTFKWLKAEENDKSKIFLKYIENNLK